MSSNWDMKTLIDFAQRNWHKPIGLIASIIAALTFEILLLNSVKASTTITILVYVLTLLFLFSTWIYSNRYPKTHKGKVGFVVCIQFSNDNQKQIIRDDFVTTLRKLLKGGALGHTFHFIEIPKHISDKVFDMEDAHKLRLKTKSHFLIIGRVRLRTLGGKESHILDLDGIVIHRPLNETASAIISREFRELFPRRLRIATENDLLAFNFTSDWTECVAKYIIGIAASYSTDLNYAERLYRDVQKKLEGIKTEFPIFIKLKERLPIRFSEIYIARALSCLTAWRETKDDEALAQFALNLSRVCSDLSDTYEVLLLHGIEAFLNGRRINEAIAYTKRCKPYNDPVWHFNLAFLLAYQNDLYKSIREYNICSKYEIAPSTISEIEDFLVWILEEEPEKYQYHYCLGYYNWNIKGDLLRAIEDFNEFLKHAKQGEFVKEQELTLKWISKIEKQMSESIRQN